MGTGPKAPFRLRCNFLEEPLGITAHPTFSWWVDDSRTAEVQSAYEIQAASSTERLLSESADLWISGRIEGCENAHIPYQGLPVSSSQAVSWRVRTFDSDGEASPWSEAAVFEMGLLAEAGFSGDWISGGVRGNRHSANTASLVRCDFELAEAPALARIYVGLKGQAKVYLNDVEVADLAPVWLDYSRKYPLFTIDVGAHLKAGVNSLVFLLADGIYAGAIPRIGREVFGAAGQLKAWLQCELISGRKVDLVTGGDWHWHPAWVDAGEWLYGDTIDMRYKHSDVLAQPPLREWGVVALHADDGTEPQSNTHQAVGRERLEPVGGPTRRLINSPNGPKRIVATVTFAEALRGSVVLLVTGKEIDQVDVRYLLDGSETSTVDRYTTRGDASLERLQAEFSCHHFCAVEIEYSVKSTLVENVFAVRQSAESAVPQIETDHATLNKLLDALSATTSMVAQSAPIQGVLAAQQLPDMGYVSGWAPIVALDPENYALLAKWLHDANLSLSESNGPYETGREVSAVDSDEYARFESVLQLTWSLYRYQNAHQVLADNYPQLRATALGFRHLHEDLLRRPRADYYGPADGGSLVATARFYGHVRLLANIAGVLNAHGDQEILDKLAKEVREAFRRRFVTGDGHLVADSVSAVLAALHWRLLDENEEDRVQLSLLDRVRSAKYQVAVAPAVVTALLPELSRAGRLDVAYMVLLQTTPSSWMGQMLDGRKIVYADDKPDAAQLGIWSWLISEVVGLSLPSSLDSEDNGFRRLRLAPKPPLGAHFQAGAPFNEVNAKLQTLYGSIEISWQIRERSFDLQLLLPPGASAEVELPDGVTQKVQSGRHSFAMEFAKGGDGVPILREVAEN